MIADFKEIRTQTPFGEDGNVIQIKIEDEGNTYRLRDIISQEDTYTFAIWHKSDTNCDISFNILGSHYTDTSTSEWKKYVQTVTVDSLDNKNIDIVPPLNSTTYYFEAFLVHGKQDTSWTPAPEDDIEEISIVKSEFIQLANEFRMTVSDMEGNMSQISQKVDNIETEVKDATGENYSSLKQRLDSISTEVVNSDGFNSAINQKANEIELKVSQKAGKYLSGIKYIRDWLNGSDVDDNNYYCELKIFQNSTNIEEEEKNIAKDVIPSSDSTIIDEKYYTDDIVNYYKQIENDLGDFEEIIEEKYCYTDSGDWHYIQLEFDEIKYDITKIQVWHYFYDRRAFNHKLEISMDGEKWITLFDSDIQGRYPESGSGKTYYINDDYAEQNSSSIKIDVDSIKETVVSNTGRINTIETNSDGIKLTAQEGKDIAEELKNEKIPEIEEDYNSKFSELNVTVDGIRGTVATVQGDLKKVSESVQDADNWKVTLKTIGIYDGDDVEPEVEAAVELTYDGLKIQTKKSDGYITVMNGDTIKIEHTRGNNLTSETSMEVQKDMMYLTRVHVKNGINHGTIREIPQIYTFGEVTKGALAFISGTNSNS